MGHSLITAVGNNTTAAQATYTWAPADYLVAKSQTITYSANPIGAPLSTSAFTTASMTFCSISVSARFYAVLTAARAARGQSITEIVEAALAGTVAADAPAVPVSAEVYRAIGKIARRNGEPMADVLDRATPGAGRALLAEAKALLTQVCEECLQDLERALETRLADEAAAAMALIENIQREDLNPIDRALGYRTLITELGLTQAELAGRMGEERSSVANFMRLLELQPAVQEMVKDGRLPLAHADAPNVHVLRTRDHASALAAAAADDGNTKVTLVHGDDADGLPPVPMLRSPGLTFVELQPGMIGGALDVLDQLRVVVGDERAGAVVVVRPGKKAVAKK